MLEKLNEEQYQAVTCVDKHLCVIAGAGSGKTRVITTRIAHLIETHKIKGYRILAVTFTNRAANEMKERLAKMIDGEMIQAMTLHSLCVKILRADISVLDYPSSFTIIDNDDQKRILKYIIKDKTLDIGNLQISDVIKYISNNKIEEVSTKEAYKYAKTDRAKLLASLYEKYELRLNQLQSLDFNDLLLYTKAVLQYPEIRLKWQNRFSFIHVDEFQDIDTIQYAIIKSLVGEHTNLCVVGDPDQCIYSFRGAKLQLMLNFEKDFINARQIILHQNYRSTPEILKAANSLIAHNENRVVKDLSSSQSNGSKVHHFSGHNETEEARFVANKIKELYPNTNYSDIAILYRSNFSSRMIEKALKDAKIPYYILGNVRFYERMEIKDALSYLRLLVDNPAIDLAIDRIINVPKRGIGEKSVALIRETAIKEKLSMYDVIKNNPEISSKLKKTLAEFVGCIEKYRVKIQEMPIHKVLGSLLSEVGYYAMLKDANDEERLENIIALLADIKEYDENNEDGNIESYLQDIALYSEQSDMHQDAVNVMTIHAAKGNEFDTVFIYNFSEGIFPTTQSLDRQSLEEERRVAYVAMTRAKKQLFFCESKGNNIINNHPKTPSRFIGEINSNLIQRLHETNSMAVITSSHSNVIINRSGNKVKTGDKVHHVTFGDGIVVSLDGENAVIAFAKPHGIKKILNGHPTIKKR